MLCQNCKNNLASTHIKSVVNGKLLEYHLCNNCAHEMGFLEETVPNDFLALINSLFGNSSLDSKIRRCPQCGATIQEISSIGKLGCSNCYEFFRDDLLPSIQKIHGNAVHKGKTPGRSALVIKNPNTAMEPSGINLLEQKQIQLKNAISEQRFEDAAILRDEIKMIVSEKEKNNE